MYRHISGLGDVQGIEHPHFQNVEQYNGIPYGSFPARWTQASLVTKWPNNTWNGTKYGPICPFPRIAIGMDLTQHNLDPQHDYDMDEFNCLNLNITCPKGSTPDSRLPVIVWIHGGGNCVGSGSGSGYNGAPLVNFSVKNGMPTIIVTINYRLGAFGFLASNDIRDGNPTFGDQGVGNYGLRDQLLAFEWVKQNIKAFGGDPNNVTAAGQSAGSIDIHLLMCSEFFELARPFHQAILASGVATLTVRSLVHQQGLYDQITAHLNIQSLSSPAERLQALRDVPSDTLVNAYIALGAPVQSWQATVDGVFLKTAPNVSNLSSQKYVLSIKRILIGDCALEGTIFAHEIKGMNLDYQKLQKLSSAALGQEQSQALLQAYNISPDLISEELFCSLLQLATDAEWAQPIETTARTFSNGDVFYYHVREVNPFEGPNKGLSHHGIDLLFIFLTYQQYLPKHLASLAEVFAGKWLEFANGGRPWKAYGQKADGTSTIMQFGPEGKHIEVVEASKPAYKNIQVCEKVLARSPYFVASLRGQNIVEE